MCFRVAEGVRALVRKAQAHVPPAAAAITNDQQETFQNGQNYLRAPRRTGRPDLYDEPARSYSPHWARGFVRATLPADKRAQQPQGGAGTPQACELPGAPEPDPKLLPISWILWDLARKKRGEL